MTHRRTLVALAALLALPACSAAFYPPGYTASRAALLSDASSPLDRVCRVSREPAELPAADLLVDSAGFTSAAAALWRQAGRPKGHVLFAMRYDPEGLNVRREVIEHRLPAALADTLQKLAYAHRRTAALLDHEWGVRMRMDLDEAPVVRVGRAEVCAPRPREGASGGLMSGTGASWGDVRDTSSPFAASSPAALYDEGTVWVRVALDARGFVTDARVERSTQRSLVENRLLAYVRSITFFPAMEDGYPVPGQLSLPMRMGRR